MLADQVGVACFGVGERTLGLSRFDMKYSNGQLAHDAAMRSIELYGTRVAPRVRELLAERPASLMR